MPIYEGTCRFEVEVEGGRVGWTCRVGTLSVGRRCRCNLATTPQRQELQPPAVGGRGERDVKGNGIRVGLGVLRVVVDI